ncbi:hypothetical protein [Sphingomonas melonis]|uniref:Tip attachment protein J domain-containing protein n=1 Tax=Sphingomonas melonis TaxID=152682 RepID=A0A7Y9FQ61_9SPHN|nr:hypothetical protein [Sphingomonas melonis]NYD91389.1 hypothetical protein [Sphingomonas melonis]
MAKALKIAAIGIGAAALIATGVGAVALGGLAGSLTLFGVSTSTMLLAAGGLSAAASLLMKAPKVPASQTERLTASIDPRAFRKTVLGQTAMPVDVRFEEWSGKDQEYCDWVVAHASHASDGIEEIWFNTEMAWSATTGVVGKYRGYFSVPHIVLEGSPANAFVIGSGRWNQSARLTGCTYSHWRFKVTGNSKKAESPFSSGLPSRITVIGRGAKLYDPRRDSTVPGGNGPMRANDQSTWRYTADDGAVIGENLALHVLRVVLGWRIRNPTTGEMKLATGSGVPARRLDLGSFIVAANLADELVNRSAGGQEPRYHGASVISEGDDAKTALDMLCAACCGRFRDTGGKLALVIAHNDLALAAVDAGLNDDDVIGAFNWNPDAALETVPNVVRGKYVDASTNSLYQMIDYPEVRLASLDGQDRIFPLDLGAVESPSHAQRVAKQILQRKQYPREFTAPFDIRAWKYAVGDPVPFTFAPLSFARALFRVKEQELGQNGTCNMTLTFESASFYQWDASDAPPVQAAAAIVYDASNSALVQAIDEAGTTANWSAVADDDGKKPEDGATVGAPVGTNVGDRPVVDVIKQIDKARADIDGLVATVGEGQTDLSQQVDAANAARDASQAARDQSQAARDAASAAQVVASDAAKASAVSVTDAKGFAQTASGAATTATQKAGEAGSSASTASASADIAKTQAGQASASAGRAATSETNAAGSSNSAASSASLSASARDQAGVVAANLILSTFTPDTLKYWYVGSLSGTPTARMATPWGYEFYQNNGWVVRLPPRDAVISPAGVVSYVPGRIVRTAVVGANVDNLNGTHYIGLAYLDANYNQISAQQVGIAAADANHTRDLTIGTVAGAVYVRPYFSKDVYADGRYEIRSITITDVTSEVTGKGYADASSASASSAAASNTAAGQSASAAESSRQAAVTARGGAESARDTAVTSASGAQGSANTAATQAVLASRSATDAAANSANDNRSPGMAMTLWSYNQYNDFAPTNNLTQDGIFSAVGGMLRVGANTYHVHPKGPTRLQPGKRYRLYARVKLTQDGPQVSGHILCCTFFDANGALMAGNTVLVTSIPNFTVADGYKDITAVISGDGSSGFTWPAGAAWGRVMYRTSGTPCEVSLLYMEDVEGQTAAQGYANAANTSASTASTKADAAGASASAADKSKLDAQAANGSAQSAAGAASGSAVAADASRAQAQTYASLSSSFGNSALNRNPFFADPAWSTAGNGNTPPGYVIWSQSGGGFIGPYGGAAGYLNPYSGLRSLQVDRQGLNCGVRIGLGALPRGWYVMEVDVRAEDGIWTGAGVHINFNNGYESDNTFSFGRYADTSEVITDQANNRRQWAFLVYNGADSTNTLMYLMAGWERFGSYGQAGVGFLRTIWHKAVIRPATNMEIEGRRALTNAATNATRIEQINKTLSDQYGSLAQRVSNTEATAGNLASRTGITETAVADLRTKQAAARIELTAGSGGGNATATIRSDTINGTAIDFGADNINFVGNVKVQKNVGGNVISIDSDHGFIITAPNGVRVIELTVD